MAYRRVNVKLSLLRGAMFVLLSYWENQCCLCCRAHSKEQNNCSNGKVGDIPRDQLNSYRSEYENMKEKLLVLSTCGHMMKTVDPIIHGETAPPKWWPWQALLQSPTASCGGTLISLQWVLTAAHCTPETNYVLLGTNSLTSISSSTTAQARGVKESYVHEEYDHVTVKNDIMLLKLSKPVTVTEYVSPICLPNLTTDFSKSTECYITGWGRDDIINQKHLPDDLQQLKVTVMDETLCVLKWLDITVSVSLKNMCINQWEDYSTGPCQGDSGGPLSCEVNGEYLLAGIASFVSGTRAEGACAGSLPDVFTRVTSYLDWIKKKMEKGDEDL